MTTDQPTGAGATPAPTPTASPTRRPGAVPDALTPLSIGDVVVHVSPIATLAQIDDLTATLETFRQVDAVSVEAVSGEAVQLRVRLGEPLSLAGHLRSRLGDAVVAAQAHGDRLFVSLDPERSWLVEASAPEPPGMPVGGPVAPLVRDDRAPDPGAPPPHHGAGAPPPAADAADDRSPAPARPRPDLAADVLARNVLDAIPETSVLVLDAGMHFRAVAGTALARHGYPREALLGRPARTALPILPWDLLEPSCRSALQGDASAREFETLDRGAVFEATVSPVRDAYDGTGAVLVLRDVTTRRRDAAVIAHADEMFELSFERAPIGKAIVAPDGRFLKVNAALCRLLGYDAPTLLGADFQRLTHPDDLGTDEALRRETLAGLRDGYVLEKRYVHAQGHPVHAQLSTALVRAEDGVPRWFVSQVVDLTQRRRLEDELRSGAERDALTGLWNDARLEVELGLRAQEARRYGVGASLLSVALDDFGRVDDVLGRQRGDAFLRTVANAIRATVRDCDHCAHPGADRFVVLLPHTPADGARIVADRIGEALVHCDAPGLPPGFLRASIGIAELVRGMSAERWRWHADEACRAARKAGGGRAVLGTGPEGVALVGTDGVAPGASASVPPVPGA